MKDKLNSLKKVIEFITLLVPVVLSVLRGIIGLIELVLSLFDSWKDFRKKNEKTSPAPDLETAAQNFENKVNNQKTQKDGSN